MTHQTPRGELLDEAKQHINADRNATHGEPTRNLADIANLWNILLSDKLKDDEVLQSSDVAMLMAALKLARMRAKHTRDHWSDLSGYAAIGYECDLVIGNIHDG